MTEGKKRLAKMAAIRAAIKRKETELKLLEGHLRFLEKAAQEAANGK
ncbi:MAG: hypothetical protein IJ849_12205 [Selenomonadaceae bacterium]|nr:hypothetical protein [Selenomonadaceae bacterium]